MVWPFIGFLFPDFVAVNVGECDDLSAGNQKKTAGNQKPTAWYQKSLPEPRDGLPADLYANNLYANKKCIADYWSLSPFMEMRNSWLLIVFSSLFFINSIASTLFISAR